MLLASQLRTDTEDRGMQYDAKDAKPYKLEGELAMLAGCLATHVEQHLGNLRYLVKPLLQKDGEEVEGPAKGDH